MFDNAPTTALTLPLLLIIIIIINEKTHFNCSFCSTGENVGICVCGNHTLAADVVRSERLKNPVIINLITFITEN